MSGVRGPMPISQVFSERNFAQSLRPPVAPCPVHLFGLIALELDGLAPFNVRCPVSSTACPVTFFIVSFLVSTLGSDTARLLVACTFCTVFEMLETLRLDLHITRVRLCSLIP